MHKLALLLLLFLSSFMFAMEMPQTRQTIIPTADVVHFTRMVDECIFSFLFEKDPKTIELQKRNILARLGTVSRALDEYAVLHKHEIQLLKGKLCLLNMIPHETEFEATLYFQQAARQDSDKKSQAEALIWLARIYEYGFGVSIDEGQAKHYYRLASKQTDNSAVRANAFRALGELHCFNEMHQLILDNRVLSKALKLFEDALECTHEPRERAWLWLRMGEIYYAGLKSPARVHLRYP